MPLSDWAYIIGHVMSVLSYHLCCLFKEPDLIHMSAVLMKMAAKEDTFYIVAFVSI